ncbi:leucine-rich repeat and immunoglobulin-like domain-containing nogo receptor-interacting protein 1 [Pseudomyrmex gracilis]|uniref:leucine-rich repeat and immunoglobulin-like domain-containing nogo receptor-interacting protein 1 n=1 Tax=Pseudomyrmex gracilis TaxID=219809 RepID=UPI0009949CAA|nr:leucine-rich repeat and immunoglobulin-like domain-containing nogo receptor-interacting protein 1 [Pseudomyrmex gracilis]
MKQILGLYVLATILAACSAGVCRPGLKEHQDWYRCEGLTNISQELQIPGNAVGIEIVDSDIKTIPTDAFAALGDSLEELNITKSGVEEIEPNAFRGLGKLRVLGLVDNKIRKLNSSWIQDLTYLKNFLVWNNKIVAIDSRIYDLLPNLEVWDVAYNELVDCLPPEQLKKLTKLKLIYLAGNKWLYRCRRDMTYYLGRNHVRFVHDWGSSDLLIDECLAHAPHADISDAALETCVDQRITNPLAALYAMTQNLTTRVNRLEAYVALLNDTYVPLKLRL